MKKILFGTILLVLVPGINLSAQDVLARFEEARSAYQSGNLENARFALQEALKEINQVIGKEILDLLPSGMNGMTIADSSENVTGTSVGFAGLYVNRQYTGENRDASVEIISDSPLLAGINAMLNMPAFMGSNPDQKRIKVSNYKALLSKQTDDQGITTYDVQLPCSNLLLNFKCTGIQSENEVTGMVNSLPVDQIVKLTQ